MSANHPSRRPLTRCPLCSLMHRGACDVGPPAEYYDALDAADAADAALTTIRVDWDGDGRDDFERFDRQDAERYGW